MKSKKALMSASFIVGLVITIAGFMVVTPLVVKFMGEDVKKAENMCQKSIALRAAMTINIGGKELKYSPVLCNTLDVDIKGKKEEIMENLAYRMARCWWMFGEGGYEEILGDKIDLVKTVLGLARTENGCFVCYSIIIKDNDFKGKITNRELFEYMETHNHYLYDISYLDYIQSFKGGGPGMLAFPSDIETGKAYGISYIAKNKKEGGWFSKFGAVLAGAGVIGGLISCPTTFLVGCSLSALSFAAGGTLTIKTAEHEIRNLFTERDVSIIYLDELKRSEQACFKGDLAGK